MKGIYQMETNRSRFVMFLCAIAVMGSCVCGGVLDRQKAKADADPNSTVLWYDCKDMLVEGKGWTDTKSFYDRLPAKAEGVVREVVWRLSRASSGLCVRFKSDAKTMQVRWTLVSEKLDMFHMPATGVSGIDLYVREKDGRWWFLENGRPTAVSNIAPFNLSGISYILHRLRD